MLAILVGGFEAELSGSQSELQTLRSEILALATAQAQSVRINTDTCVTVAPYDRALSKLVINRSTGPTKVAILDNALIVTGSDVNLASFATWLEFPAGSADGAHAHFEHIPGSSHVAEDSLPLVISVRHAST